MSKNVLHIRTKSRPAREVGAKYLGPGLVKRPKILVKRLVMGATVKRGPVSVIAIIVLIKSKQFLLRVNYRSKHLPIDCREVS